jgi:hypothetical protein
MTMAFIAYLKQRRAKHNIAASQCAYCRDEFHGQMPGCDSRCRFVPGVPVSPPYLR